VTDVLGESRVAGVALSDGSRIDADVVVVGIGVTPNTEWLERSGLTNRQPHRLPATAPGSVRP